MSRGVLQETKRPETAGEKEPSKSLEEWKVGCLAELEVRATPESGDTEDRPLPLIPQGSAQEAPLQDVLCPPVSLGGRSLPWV